MTEEQLQALYSATIKRAATNGWYLAGELEWIDSKPWQPEGFIGTIDLLWVKAEIWTDKQVIWAFAIGSDPDNYYKTLSSTTCRSIMDILEWAANDIYIGKWGVRLKGMTQWVLRQDKIEQNEPENRSTTKDNKNL